MRLELPAGGVAAVRFGVSPLFELAALVRRLRQGVRGPLAESMWTRWTSALGQVQDDEAVALVLQLMSSREGSVIWVAGTPSMGRTFGDDLAAVSSLDEQLLDTELARYTVSGDRTRNAPARERIEAGLLRLWQALLEDSWPAVRATAEHEVARMTEVLRTRGWVGVFDSVCDGISWDGQGLQLAGITAKEPSSSDLVLAPSAFVVSGPIVRMGVTEPSVVFFPARGVGNLFATVRSDPRGLAALLGQNRARVLLALRHPTTVSRLRDLLGLSLGSLSRHLSVLAATELASSRRVGRTVEYKLTDLGRTLVSAQRIDAGFGDE